MSVTTVDFWVKSFDNTYLKCAKDVVNSPKATILILHELAEHYKRYDYVTNKFVENNLMCIDTTIGDMVIQTVKERM